MKQKRGKKAKLTSNPKLEETPQSAKAIRVPINIELNIAGVQGASASIKAATPQVKTASIAGKTVGPAKIGPLLSRAITVSPEMAATRSNFSGGLRASLDALMATDNLGAAMPLPLIIAAPRLEAGAESWAQFKQRAADTLGPISEWLKANAGIQTTPSYAAMSLSGKAVAEQVSEAAKHEQVQRLELDPLRRVTLLDDVSNDIESPIFHRRRPTLDGSGVKVAIIDSGIDTKHPWLAVAKSVETRGESVDIPGAHATHVAGCLASRDAVYRGVAPGVTLYNVKCADSIGRAEAGHITRGIDAALDLGVDVISMSVGLNHLPKDAQDGQAWVCPDGKCEMCTAVKNAFATGVFVVAAAGNAHQIALNREALGYGRDFDSEICCPATALAALTVGSITKQTFSTADFSSRGPASHGGNKPDIAAPGVNITSAALARRDNNGNVVPNLTRGDLSRSDSGTSFATPIVAGAVALIIQKRRAAGLETTPATVRAELFATCVRHLRAPTNEVGVGRLDIADL